MTRQLKITCNHCGNELKAGLAPSYVLQLQARRLVSNSDVASLVLTHPPINEDMDFCGFKCLSIWMTANNKGI